MSLSVIPPVCVGAVWCGVDGFLVILVGTHDLTESRNEPIDLSRGGTMAQNFSPNILARLARELKDLVKEPIDGVKLLWSEDDITDIQADISGPEGTPFESGVFRVKLHLGAEFPHVPPKGYFLTKIFHPNVAANGEICVNTLKRDWKSDLGLKHIFMVLRCLLIDPNPESALNEEAGKLLLEEYDEYFKHAKLITRIHARGDAESSTVVEKKREAKETRKMGDKKRSMKRL